MDIRYRVGDLRENAAERFRNRSMRKGLREEKSDFKPVVFGDKESKKINDDAYKAMRKEVSKHDGGLSDYRHRYGDAEESFGYNDNRGMHDLRYDNINGEFEDRVKSQAKGYVSAQAEKLHKKDAFGNAKFDDDRETVKPMAKHAKRIKRSHDTASEIGLTGRELPKKDIEALDKTALGEGRKIKVISFNRTQFVNENHVMSRIPDNYKVEGSRFIMKDMKNNQYLVEWHDNDPQITKKVNMKTVTEETERAKQLWGYCPGKASQGTNPSMRLNEESELDKMMKRTRKLMSI